VPPLARHTGLPEPFAGRRLSRSTGGTRRPHSRRHQYQKSLEYFDSGLELQRIKRSLIDVWFAFL
jgi:hypothetical protein